jgi:hypothetical protein
LRREVTRSSARHLGSKVPLSCVCIQLPGARSLDPPLSNASAQDWAFIPYRLGRFVVDTASETSKGEGSAKERSNGTHVACR